MVEGETKDPNCLLSSVNDSGVVQCENCYPDFKLDSAGKCVPFEYTPDAKCLGVGGNGQCTECDEGYFP